MTGERASVAESGETLLVSQLALIERVIAFTCRRHHLSSADADDFASHVKLRLVEDDYAILRQFQGRSSFRTYLTVVIQRLFLDFRIKAWGKWRPSAEARRNGPVAVLLERLIVRDGHSFEEAFELMTTNHAVTTPRAELERLAGLFPSRAKRRFESEDVLAGVPSREEAPDQTLAHHDASAATARVSSVLRDLTRSLETQDRLILDLRFEDGRTIADIAGMLHLEPKPLYRRFERLLRDLRRGLEAAGVDPKAVFEALESPAATLDWSDRRRETGGLRPSIEKGAEQWR